MSNMFTPTFAETSIQHSHVENTELDGSEIASISPSHSISSLAPVNVSGISTITTSTTSCTTSNSKSVFQDEEYMMKFGKQVDDKPLPSSEMDISSVSILSTSSGKNGSTLSLLPFSSSPSPSQSCISSHTLQDKEEEDEEHRGYQNNSDLSTPDLWNALCSLVDDDEEAQHHLTKGKAKHKNNNHNNKDSSIRFDTAHDIDVVEWDRMDHLMCTHEYGAWMSRPTTHIGAFA